MRLPRTLMINGERWQVKFKPLFKRYGIYGRCSHRGREIQIDWRLPHTEKLDTFLHEVMHACLPEETAPRTEEFLVERLSTRLLTVLQGIGWAP